MLKNLKRKKKQWDSHQQMGSNLTGRKIEIEKGIQKMEEKA